MRWPMIRLVAGRELRERMRTKTFMITTLVLLVASLLGVIIPAFVSDDGPERQTIALAASGTPGLDDALSAAAGAQDRELVIRDYLVTGRRSRSAEVVSSEVDALSSTELLDIATVARALGLGGAESLDSADSGGEQVVELGQPQRLLGRG